METKVLTCRYHFFHKALLRCAVHRPSGPRGAPNAAWRLVTCRTNSSKLAQCDTGLVALRVAIMVVSDRLCVCVLSVQNAVKFTPPKGEVLLSVCVGDENSLHAVNRLVVWPLFPMRVRVCQLVLFCVKFSRLRLSAQLERKKKTRTNQLRKDPTTRRKRRRERKRKKRKRRKRRKRKRRRRRKRRSERKRKKK